MAPIPRRMFELSPVLAHVVAQTFGRAAVAIAATAVSAVLALGLLSAGPVAAHAELISSSPRAGEELRAAPDQVVLTFEREVRDDSIFRVTDAGGRTVGSGELDLDVAERNVLRGAVEASASGVYTVDWSVTDVEDGDTTTGAFTFSVMPPDGSAAAPAATATTGPDTALGSAAPSGASLPSVPTAIGGMLVAVASAWLVASSRGVRAERSNGRRAD